MPRFLTIVKPIAALIFLSVLVVGCASRNGLDQAGGYGSAAPGTSQDFTINVGDRVFFDLDSSAVRPDGQQTLQRQAQWLMKYPQYPITIEGHSDERGTREYNLALGQRRAVAVRDYLVAQGLPASRMRTISYGKERPVAVCDDLSCWNQNRRAVTVIGAYN